MLKCAQLSRTRIDNLVTPSPLPTPPPTVSVRREEGNIPTNLDPSDLIEEGLGE